VVVENDDKKGTLEKILDAAAGVFARQGYLGANLNDVAREAGVTKPTLYNYFECKAELYSEMLGHVHKKFMRELDRAAAGEESVREKMRAVLEAHYRFARENAELVKVVHTMMFLPEDVRPKVNQMLFMEEKFGFLDRLAREGIASGELLGDSMDIAMVVSSLSTLGMAQAIFPSLPLLQRGTARRLWDVVYRGVGRRETGDGRSGIESGGRDDGKPNDGEERGKPSRS
jgi:AcrR family transcriptional regulator